MVDEGTSTDREAAVSAEARVVEVEGVVADAAVPSCA